MVKWQTVKIFISSTFDDMLQERDSLVRYVFPQIRKKLEPYSIRLIDIDLRWGIINEDVIDNKALDICLKIVEETKPFFIGLVGDRYGQVISKYPKTAIENHPWITQFENYSITNLEIQQGVYNGYDSINKSALICIKQNKNKNNPNVENLKNDIILSGVRHFFYTKENNIDYSNPSKGLEEFIEEVSTNLWNILYSKLHLKELQTKILNKSSFENNNHDGFANSIVDYYIQREKHQNSILKYIFSDENKTCLLYGKSGMGKTTLLSWLYNKLKLEDETNVIAHFVGATPSSVFFMKSLERLGLFLKDTYKSKYEIPEENEKLLNILKDFLPTIEINAKITYIIIDSIDKFIDFDIVSTLSWLPNELPKNIKLIFSCVNNENTIDLLNTYNNFNHTRIEIDNFTRSESLNFIQKIPSISSKKLDEKQIDCLLNNKHSKNPLFLSVALENLHFAKKHNEIDNIIANFPSGNNAISSLFEQTIQELENAFGKSLVKETLCFLAISKTGMPEEYLQELISNENNKGSFYVLIRNFRKYLQYDENRIRIFHSKLNKSIIQRYLSKKSLLRNYHFKFSKYLIEKGFEDELTLIELPWQLSIAKKFEELTSVLSDFDFIKNKIKKRSITELQNDFLIAIESIDNYKSNIDFDYNKYIESLVSQNKFEKKSSFLGEMLKYFTKDKTNSQTNRNNKLLNGEKEKLIIERYNKSYPVPPPNRVKNYTNNITNKEKLILLEFNKFINVHFYVLKRIPDDILIIARDSSENGLVAHKSKHLYNNITKPLIEPNNRENKSPFFPINYRILHEHVSAIEALVITPDGETLVSGSRDFTIRVWDTNTGFCTHKLLGHTDWVRCMSITPDGKYLLTGSQDKSVRFWNIKSEKCIHAYINLPYMVTSVSLSADAKIGIATAKSLFVFDLQTFNIKRTINLPYKTNNKPDSVNQWYEHSENIFTNASLSSDGQVVAGFRGYGNLHLWHTHTGTLLKEYVSKSHGEISNLTMSKNGRIIITTHDITISVLKINSSIPLFQLKSSISNPAIAVTDDNKFLFASGNNKIEIWDISNKTLYKTIKDSAFHENDSTDYSIAISADGRICASSTFIGKILLWDIEKGELNDDIIQKHKGRIRKVITLFNSKIAIGLSENEISIWNNKEIIIKSIENHTNMQSSSDMYIIEDKNLLIVPSSKQLKFFNLSSFGLLHTYEFTVGHFELMPDKSTLILGGTYATFGIYNIKERNGHDINIGLLGYVSTIAPSPDGRYVAICGNHKTIQIIDLHIKKSIKILDGHKKRSLNLIFSPDGKYLISGSDDSTVRIWSLLTGDVSVLKKRSGVFIRFLHLTKDSKYIVSCDSYNIEIWSLNKKKHIGTIKSNTLVYSLLLSPDGNYLIFSTSEMFIEIWNIKTLKRVLKYYINTIGMVSNISPTGEFSIATYGDTIKFFKIKHIKFDLPIVSGARIYRSSCIENGCRNKKLSIDCPWCNNLMELNNIHLDYINSNKENNNKLCKDDYLEIECSACTNHMKLSPFICDTSNFTLAFQDSDYSLKNSKLLNLSCQFLNTDNPLSVLSAVKEFELIFAAHMHRDSSDSKIAINRLIDLFKYSSNSSCLDKQIHSMAIETCVEIDYFMNSILVDKVKGETNPTFIKNVITLNYRVDNNYVWFQNYIKKLSVDSSIDIKNHILSSIGGLCETDNYKHKNLNIEILKIMSKDKNDKIQSIAKKYSIILNNHTFDVNWINMLK